MVAHLPAKLAAKVTGWSAHQASCSPAIPALCGLDQDLPLELDLAAGIFFSFHGIPPVLVTLEFYPFYNLNQVFKISTLKV